MPFMYLDILIDSRQKVPKKRKDLDLDETRHTIIAFLHDI